MNKFNHLTETLLMDRNLITEQYVFSTMKAYCMMNEKYNYFTDEDLKILAESFWSWIKDWGGTLGHIAADVVGFLDPTGIVDAVHAIVYFFTGHPILGLLTLIGVIPYIGDVAKLFKYGEIGRALASGTVLSSRTLVAAAPKLEKILNMLKGVGPKLTEFVNKLLSSNRVVEMISSKLGPAANWTKTIFTKITDTLSKVINWITIQLSKVAGKPIAAMQKYKGPGAGNAAVKKAMEAGKWYNPRTEKWIDLTGLRGTALRDTQLAIAKGAYTPVMAAKGIGGKVLRGMTFRPMEIGYHRSRKPRSVSAQSPEGMNTQFSPELTPSLFDRVKKDVTRTSDNPWAPRSGRRGSR